MSFSVLMSIYAKESPDYLRSSLKSVFSQTLPANEVILVIDGPISEKLNSVIKEFSTRYNEMKIIPLLRNVGLGNALNKGLLQCSYDLVARMDTDDICKSDRFEKQVAFMKKHPEISVLGAFIDEFIDSPEHIISTRKLPENHEEIVSFAKSRCPINHPAVMFRKKDVISVGSYKHFPLMEDYYLWVRMLSAGYKFHNIQESLLLFRVSPDMFRRRGGVKYFCNEVKFQKELFSIGFINFSIMTMNIIIRLVIRLMPNSMRSFIYKSVLRRKSTPPLELTNCNSMCSVAALAA